jgi:tetratricopeptide (TPR) repeat protein
MSTATSPNKQWFQFFWPMLICLLFIAGLAGYRQHRIWIARTRLNFSVGLPPSHYNFNIITKLDGHPFVGGDKVFLGFHHLVLSADGCDTWETNLFIWYGGKDLGAISLARTTGTLNVKASPMARVVRVSGADYTKTFVNVGTLTQQVPVDQYQVEATFARGLTENQTVNVQPGQFANCNFAPPFGTIQITANQPDTTYTLFDNQDNRVATGTLPANEENLTAGSYRVNAIYHGHTRSRQVELSAGKTNAVDFSFVFGTAHIETEPAHATVIDAANQVLGNTPLDLAELEPPALRIAIELPGYKRIETALAITANQNTELRTNLVDLAYFNAMQAAQNALNVSNYDAAQTALEKALYATPNETNALAMLAQVKILGHLQYAQTLAARGDYLSATNELNTVLGLSPGNAEATTLWPEYTAQIPAQLERVKQERTKLPHEGLVNTLYKKSFGNEFKLFPEHTFTVAMPADQVRTALLDAFRKGSPAFEITSAEMPWSNCLGFVGEQSVSGGRRVFAITGAQLSTNETRVAYEIMEYQTKHEVSLNGGLSFNTSYVPLEPSKIGPLTEAMQAQITAGLELIRNRIHQALGDVTESP